MHWIKETNGISAKDHGLVKRAAIVV